MGFKTEFNWILKLKPEQGLDESVLESGNVYDFWKNEYRIYPIDIPIDLVNKDWEAIAKVVVLEFKNFENKTHGRYKVIKIYNEGDRSFLSKYWQDSVNYNK